MVRRLVQIVDGRVSLAAAVARVHVAEPAVTPADVTTGAIDVVMDSCLKLIRGERVLGPLAHDEPDDDTKGSST